MKLKKKLLTMGTTVVETATNTSEIIKELKGMEGGQETYIIQLYSTLSIRNPERMDATTQLLVNKMREMK